MALDIQHQPLRDLPPFHSTPTMDDRPSLPPIGLDISRPPSTSSQASSQFNHRRPSPNPHAHLPGLSQLSALASAATSTSPDSNHSKESVGHFQNYIQRSRLENARESDQAAPRSVRNLILDRREHSTDCRRSQGTEIYMPESSQKGRMVESKRKQE
jgi:hypothetical protein